MIEKLKREWKTFVLSLATVSIGVWEGARDMGYDLTPVIPEKYRPFAIPGVGIAFLILRQWRDIAKTTTITETKTIEKKIEDA